MRVLVFAPSFAPAVHAGGPARSLTNLVTAAAAHHEVLVVTADRDLGCTSPFPGLSGRRVTRGRATVYYVDLQSTIQLASIIGELKGQEFDLILLNSVWHRTLAALPATLCALGVLLGPVVLMPRGELEPGAMALKHRKKRVGAPVARFLYRRVISAIGTTSASEAGEAQDWFPDVPVLRTTNSPDSISFGVPARRDQTLRVVVVGRIHATKGLLPLLQGLMRTRGHVTARAVGPLEDRDYWADCEAVIGMLPNNTSLTYEGPAPRAEIPALLWNSDCMVLLTAGENYGHVIAESLQAGCPVITTPTTPWTDVIRGGGGEIVEDRDDSEEVAAVLDRWAAKTPSELAASRLHAREAFDTFAAQAGPNIIELALEALDSGASASRRSNRWKDRQPWTVSTRTTRQNTQESRMRHR